MDKKLVISLAVIGIVFLCFPHSARSASEFTEKDQVKYTINEDGSTHVVQNISIINKTAEYYTSKYTLGIGGQKISNLRAYEKSRTLKTDFTESSTAAIIVNFADQVIGKNVSRNFFIEYDSNSIAQKLGTSWSIAIPRVSSKDLEEYNTVISVPESLGSASTIFPKPADQKEVAGRTEYSFTTEQMTKSGVTLNFGDKQVYTMGLTYHLNNSQRNSVYTEIALPMNTPYQTIVYESLNPKPQSILPDEDGNYIARYILKPKETIQVQAIAKAVIYTKKQYRDNYLTSIQKKTYTDKQPYWEVDNPKIIELARQLKTPEQIYRYVVTSLNYNSSKVNNNFDRLGALKVLDTPDNSVCMEFTDLFIALSRAAGIPAREINGYAFTSDGALRPASLSQDTLHAWPEYYDDERGWVQVDPTWENTTKGVDYFNAFDLNHIAFVQKGISSQTPYPAGAYKGEDQNTRDVVVNFISEEPEIKSVIDTKVDVPESHVAGTELTWKIELINSGNTGYLDTIEEDTQLNTTKKSTQIPVVIPPYSSITLTRNGLRSTAQETGTALLSVKVGNHFTTKQITIVPFYRHSVTLIGIAYLVGVPGIALFSYKVLHKK